MFANLRLNSIYKRSPILPFNNSSKLVLMSDCHRGTGSWADNFLKNQHIYFAALNNYFEKGFTYIELGDGDELWENRKMEHIISTHSNVFWLLSKFYKNNRFYMLFGNHDMRKKHESYVYKYYETYYCESYQKSIDLFPNIKIHQGLILEHSSKKNRFLLIHGHQGDFINDYLWPFSKVLVRFAWRNLELIGVLDPTSSAKNNNKCKSIEKNLSSWVNSNKIPLICGHTHRPTLPPPGNTPYINTGSCVHPRCITCIEIENNNISLVKWSVVTDDFLHLYVGREVLAGPYCIDCYFTNILST